MQIMRMFSYLEWSESEARVLRAIQEQSVSNEEVFLRKLVNATVIRNRLYEHISNESEEGERHIVYVKPFRKSDLEGYGAHIEGPLFERCDRAADLEAVFLCWTETKFQQKDLPLSARELNDVNRLLLDHYLVISGRTYEAVYSVLDTDMNKIAFFLREVEDEWSSIGRK